MVIGSKMTRPWKKASLNSSRIHSGPGTMKTVHGKPSQCNNVFSEEARERVKEKGKKGPNLFKGKGRGLAVHADQPEPWDSYPYTSSFQNGKGKGKHDGKSSYPPSGKPGKNYPSFGKPGKGITGKKGYGIPFSTGKGWAANETSQSDDQEYLQIQDQESWQES